MLVDWNSEHLSYKVGYKYGRLETELAVIKCTTPRASPLSRPLSWDEAVGYARAF